MRRRRRRNNYTNDDDVILLAEFEFYNKEKKIIDDSIINEIREKLETRDRIFWTDNNFFDKGIVFEFYKKDILRRKTQVIERYINIKTLDKNKIKNISFKDINECFSIYEKFIFKYPITEIEESVIDFLCLYEKKETNYKIIKDVNNFKNNILTDLRYYFNELDKDNLNIILTFLHNTEIEDKNNYSTDGYFLNDGNLYHILKVFEYRYKNKNYRMAVVRKIESYHSTYYIFTVDDQNKRYIYFDEGKIFWFSKRDKTMLFFDNGCIQQNSEGLYFNYRMYNSIFANINNIIPKDELVINQFIYNFFRENYSNTSYKKKLSEQEIKIISKYKEILQKDKPIKINDVIITKNKIEILGEIFKIEFGDDFLNVVDYLEELKQLITGDTRYNYNELYEGILKISTIKIISMSETHSHKYKQFEQIKFKVNNMDIDVCKKNNRMYVNDVFCRIDDIYYILTKAICYTDIEEYKKYINEVAYIGIQWKKIISNGILIELQNPFLSLYRNLDINFNKTILMRFTLKWNTNDRRKISLILNNNEYNIRYKNKFKNYFDMPRHSLTIKKLKTILYECVDDLDDKLILSIITDAVKEAEVVQKRGEELVVNTIKDINANETEIILHGNKIFGYEFIGNKTGSKYFINKIDLSVYKYVNGQWNRRCVVDDHNKQRIFEDRLANRLANIYNEPQYIFTLHNV